MPIFACACLPPLRASARIRRPARPRRRFGGWLGLRAATGDGTRRYVIAQGVEMGRPSRLEIEVEKRAGAVASVRVGGNAVLVSEGTIEVPAAA